MHDDNKMRTGGNKMSEHASQEYVEMMREYPIPATKEKAKTYQVFAFGIFAVLLAGAITLIAIF